MQSIAEIRAKLDRHGLRPRHRLGQNFLHDQNQIRRLVAAARITPGELVLEVGPGTGALTEALLDTGAEVVACEIDPGLADLLEEDFGDRITLVRGDVMEKGRRLSRPVRAALNDRPFVMVSNLPYQVASPLMAGLLVDSLACRGQFVTIQREVADRLLASPGTKAYGPLTIIIRAMASVERIGTVSPACFWPQPKVTSAMVAIRPRCTNAAAGSPAGGQPALEAPDKFARFVTEIFSSRRKQLGTIFPRRDAWPAGVVPTARPETLTVEQFIELWRLERGRASCSDSIDGD